jgi:PilZ domain-containing protein
MHIERRRATRYNFGAIAEVIDLGARRDVVAITRDLSLSGCFVKTMTPFAKGTEVRVRITCSGADFAAIGKVTDVTREGMGIEFVEVLPKDRAIIEGWLGLPHAGSISSEPAPSETPETDHLARTIPVTISGELSTGTFCEETETRVVTPDGALLSLSAAVSAGQVVRLKNRMTRREQACRVLFVDPTVGTDRPKLLAVEFLESTHNFWGVEPGS